jgi:hypothetical protein
MWKATARFAGAGRSLSTCLPASYLPEPTRPTTNLMSLIPPAADSGVAAMVRRMEADAANKAFTVKRKAEVRLLQLVQCITTQLSLNSCNATGCAGAEGGEGGCDCC